MINDIQLAYISVIQYSNWIQRFFHYYIHFLTKAILLIINNVWFAQILIIKLVGAHF